MLDTIGGGERTRCWLTKGAEEDRNEVGVVKLRAIAEQILVCVLHVCF